MNNFGDFLYELRKEKGMTQAELADVLGVTNKAVSKWETGEAMPETAQLLPISRIFGVTVDELLAGKRGDKVADGQASDDSIKNHIFTRGKDEEPKTLLEKICGCICGVLMMAGILTYLLLGTLAEMWNPYWVIIPVCALSCGVIGCAFDMCNPVKRAKVLSRGNNPYTGAICGIIMCTCVAVYLVASVCTGLWHPLWVIVAGGGLTCGIVGGLGDIFTHKK